MGFKILSAELINILKCYNFLSICGIHGIRRIFYVGKSEKELEGNVKSKLVFLFLFWIVLYK